MPAKLDLYSKHKAEYIAPKTPVTFTMSPARYLAIEGESAPGAPEFQAAIGALYNVAFTVKMARKFAGRDYAVSKSAMRADCTTASPRRPKPAASFGGEANLVPKC